MKKLWSIIGILTAMLISYFLLREFMVYYADRPIGAGTAQANVQLAEKEGVLQFIGKTHASLNDFLNFGKAEQYTEGDWKLLRQWLQQEEPALQNIEKRAQDPRLKRDLSRSHRLLKLGASAGNIQYVIYGHRIYHDLDILANGFKGETNVWGYTEVGGGKEVPKLEEHLKQNPQ
ncbi:hypothetical protein [Ectobacillus ponti]|uniref:Uncharacterized protein n=1 Tax=Ectobacillus ponti TaxID=2961894 RepID=A0AA41X4N8_9BACI|nr:hypothetical protein [Ectobacillus ponti]MCP8968687.1 hypothetical protein [Ectobacillus ponti]